MPRIRRWHPVSHDFVRDREVQELRRRFGHWMTDVWLEMLAEADKNEGRIKGDYDSISRSLAWVSLSNRPETQVKHVRNALDYMADKKWISLGTDCVLVANYGEYHKTREKKESHQGTKETPSFLPSEPSLHKIPPISPPKGTLNGFDQFWKAYPKKHGKGAAERAWKTHARGVSVEVILDGIARWRVTREWSEGFIANPATWINQRRWEDEPEPAEESDEIRPGPAWEVSE